MAGSAADAQRRGQIAAQSLFTAAAAANAIPVAGQFAAAGLAIAGALTQLFAGKRKAKKERAAEAARQQQQRAREEIQGQAPQDTAASAGLDNPNGPIGPTAPVNPPQTPSFTTWGGGQSPSVQPTEQALHGAIGLRK